MNEKRLLNCNELEDSPVVANCSMNRERDLLGSNGYDIELGFNPLMFHNSHLYETSLKVLNNYCKRNKIDKSIFRGE